MGWLRAGCGEAVQCASTGCLLTPENDKAWHDIERLIDHEVTGLRYGGPYYG